MESDFIQLHTHSHFSFLDGAVTIDNYIKKAQEFNMSALAITDHGNMCGAMEFYEKAKGKVKPIIGFEAYLVEDALLKKKQNRYHLVLLAENVTGYHNLLKLSSAGFRDGFYRKPNIDKTMLRRWSEGIVCLSACMQGEVQQSILHGTYAEAVRLAEEYSEIFPGRYYLELQNHHLEDDDKINFNSYKIAKEIGVKTVATSDCHYLNQEDAFAHEVLLCISTGKTLRDKKRMRFPNNEFYFTNADDMKERFKDYPDAVTNTVEVAERCNLEMPETKYLIPKFNANTKDSKKYLKKQVEDGLYEKFGPLTNIKTEERVAEELSVINDMGFADYFLITADFIKWAKANGVTVGPGRGSAAGSMVSYALNITSVNPFDYDLLFERFLNKDRISMPDIDIDFDPINRERVYEYLQDKYGERCVGKIITYGTMRARAVIKDVSRVMGIPYNIANKLTKMIPPVDATVAGAMKQDDIQREIVKFPDLNNVFKTALVLEGLNRQPGVHAAGVIVTPTDLDDYVPLIKTSKGMATQYSMETSEKIGLLKMDLLGLNNLAIISNAVDLIYKNHKKRIKIDDLPLDDKKTYELLTSGDGLGLFQIESDGMRGLLRTLKPDKFEDIIAVLALYRPGPLDSGMVDTYVEVKHGRLDQAKIHSSIDDILGETNGVIVYQEQVMRIAQKMAGFTLSEADILRKAMGKKKKEIIEKLKVKFVSGAVKNNVNEDLAEHVYSNIEKFAEYGFNKSHSTAYAMITYQTSYLKAHYPVEYMAAVLSSKMGGKVENLVKYIRDIKKMGINIIPPDINKSQRNFTAVNGDIVFGFGGIKSVGDVAIDQMILERKKGPYKSILNFIKRNGRRVVKKDVFYALAMCGAFDDFNISRERIANGFDSISGMAGSQKGTQGAFRWKSNDISIVSDDDMAFPDVPVLSLNEILTKERELLGTYISGDPIGNKKDIIKKFRTNKIAEIPKMRKNTRILLGGVITELQEHVVKKDNTRMASFMLFDGEESISCVCFADSYCDISNKMVEDKPIMLYGMTNDRGGELQIVAHDIYDIHTLYGRDIKHLTMYISAEDYKDFRIKFVEIEKVINKHKGNNNIIFKVSTPNGKINMKEGWDYTVKVSLQFELDMEKIIGKNRIKYCLV